ncbi:MAG: primosomal protein N', partial [Planctomycetes bacterium]|nr:primosomal protein N' [Planctomycetota bacterium]
MTEELIWIAEVSLDRAGQGTYSYAIDECQLSTLVVGDLVQIPFRNKREQGFVTAISHGPAPTKYRLKNIEPAKHPLCIPSHLMQLATWGSRYYSSTIGDFLAAVVPSPVRKGVKMQVQRLVQLIPCDEQSLSKRQREIYQQLPKQALLIGEASKISKCSVSTLERMIELGALSISEESGIREVNIEVRSENHQLTDEQQLAFESIHTAITEDVFKPFLLYGVTGSGKTLVYMEAAEKVIQGGKQVLILLPEIALTPQLAARFRQRFERVSIWHSGFTAGERSAAWHKAAKGEYDLVIGTRSALFAPLPNVGLIVVDEEHDSSYKQDKNPRYQGRDLAVVYAQQLAVPIVLGSATPSCETIHNARAGRYQVLQLKERPAGAVLPRAQLVDMRDEYRKQGSQAAISGLLVSELKRCLQAGQQSIVLLNRRGWSPTVSCPQCAFVFECEHCDISLTWHKGHNALRCHLCGFERQRPDSCPVCDNHDLSNKGLGTEQLASLLAEKVPGVRIARMDADTINKRQGHADIIAAFARGEADCLVGTQMVAKGLDFPRVTLVGVIAADHGLSAPDFRAAERCYQLIAQVSGRAGRSSDPGTVVVQAYQPDAAAITCALNQQAKTFYDEELSIREKHSYPPYTALMRLV